MQHADHAGRERAWATAIGSHHDPRDGVTQARAWATVWVTIALAVGAASLLPWVLMELRPDDTEALESPLVAAAAGQLIDGPARLYGPYGGRNPRVLIHAPLYYRLTALLAWPLVHFRLDPVSACLVVGRFLSTLGFLVALVAVYHLARLGAAPRLAGWWAVLLAAATPVYGGLPFEVRPDLLGIGLQTTGVWIVLAALADDRPRLKLCGAFACFGLALCVKQHFLAAPAVSTVLLLSAAARGRVPFRAVVVAVFLAVAIVALDYAVEEWATGGRMSQSVFVAAASISRIHPADWFFAMNILLALVWKSAGPILLLAAGGIALGLGGPGAGRRRLATAATALVALIAALVVVQFFWVDMRLSGLIVAGSLALIAVAAPAFALAGWPWPGDRIASALLAYCTLELAFMAILCRLSAGAWYNYAIGGALLACALAARAVARAFDGACSRRALLVVAIAAVAAPAFALTDAREVAAKRRADRAAVGRLLRKTRPSPTEIFFVDRPGDNRVHGRMDLVYDPWLYPVFESTGLAEPRSVWLAHALGAGPIRVVIATSPRTRIDGVPHTLPGLGYRLSDRSGPFFVWTRGPVEPR
jgi:hypothetical protein